MPNENTTQNDLAQTAALGSSLCIALPIAGICSAVADYFLNHSSATVVLGLGTPVFILLTVPAMYSVLKKCFGYRTSIMISGRRQLRLPVFGEKIRS